MTGDLQENHRTCWACRELLKHDQIKCQHCGSWNNWRRYAVFSNMTLALIVAILGLVTAIASLSDQFLPKGVLISFSHGTFMQNTVDVYNNEKYPIIFQQNIWCDVNGKLNFPYEETGDLLPSDHTFELFGNIYSLSGKKSIVLPNKKYTFTAKYQSNVPSGSWGKAESNSSELLTLREVNQIIKRKWRYAPSNLGSVRYESDGQCRFSYQRPDQKNIRIEIQNPYISEWVETGFEKNWKTLSEGNQSNSN